MLLNQTFTTLLFEYGGPILPWDTFDVEVRSTPRDGATLRASSTTLSSVYASSQTTRLLRVVFAGALSYLGFGFLRSLNPDFVLSISFLFPGEGGCLSRAPAFVLSSSAGDKRGYIVAVACASCHKAVVGRRRRVTRNRCASFGSRHLLSAVSASSSGFIAPQWFISSFSFLFFFFSFCFVCGISPVIVTAVNDNIKRGRKRKKVRV